MCVDIHRAEKTDSVKMRLSKLKTTLVLVPGGFTSRVQNIDVSFDKPFKYAIRRLSEEHLAENFDLYTEATATCCKLMKKDL